MANIIEAIANACGQTAQMSKDYIDGVRDTLRNLLIGVHDRLDLMPTHEELMQMAQYTLIGEGGTDHVVVAEDFEANARYRIIAATYNPQIKLGFYDRHYTEKWTETIPLQGLEALLGYYTFEILGLDLVGTTVILRYEMNGEPQTIQLSCLSDVYQSIELQSVTFTGVDSVYRYKPGAEVVARDGRNVFVRYSAYADGREFTEEWSEGQNYVGLATAYDAPIDRADYIWMYVGAKGWDDISRALDRIIDIQRELIGASNNLFNIAALKGDGGYNYSGGHNGGLSVDAESGRINVTAIGEIHTKKRFCDVFPDGVIGNTYIMSFQHTALQCWVASETGMSLAGAFVLTEAIYNGVLCFSLFEDELGLEYTTGSVFNIMLNKGSVPVPYEPYGRHLPEVTGDNVDKMVTIAEYQQAVYDAGYANGYAAGKQTNE